jgi:hypothetical protein
MHLYDVITGDLKYSRWQHTWWNGIYSIILTKAAIFHRDYLTLYSTEIPPTILNYIDLHKNCEDIAMAQLVSSRVSIWLINSVLYYCYVFLDSYIVSYASSLGKSICS